MSVFTFHLWSTRQFESLCGIASVTLPSRCDPSSGCTAIDTEPKTPIRDPLHTRIPVLGSKPAQHKHHWWPGHKVLFQSPPTPQGTSVPLSYTFDTHQCYTLVFLSRLSSCGVSAHTQPLMVPHNSSSFPGFVSNVLPGLQPFPVLHNSSSCLSFTTL